MMVEIMNSGHTHNYYEKNNVLTMMAGEIYVDNAPALTARHGAQYLQKLYLNGKFDQIATQNGSYIFSSYDINKSIFCFGTDQNSYLPLYYSQSAEGLIFSWDFYPIINNAVDGAVVDEENLMKWFLIGGRGFNDETRFKNIKRVEPGSVVSYDFNECSIRKSKPFHFIDHDTNNERLLELDSINIEE